MTAQLRNAACCVSVLTQEPRLSLTDPVLEVMMMMLRGVNFTWLGSSAMRTRIIFICNWLSTNSAFWCLNVAFHRVSFVADGPQGVFH